MEKLIQFNILKELECFYCMLYASGHNVPGIDQKNDLPFWVI